VIATDRDLAASLDASGYTTVPGLVAPADCVALRAAFDDLGAFRKTVIMEPLGFGRGTYRYFAAPLPPLVATLRERIYALTASLANEWNVRLGRDDRYPATLAAFLDRCGAAGQVRPTPLILRYRAGDYNALHQDTYGEVAFPFQATVLLSDPACDFTGGEFTLVENRPRKQSVPHVVALGPGDAVIFPNVARPNVRGGRSTFRHGVSLVRSGERFTLGLILHDAR
jgi:hypothetical protein